mgnify:CR=1 FL=1
MEGRSAKINQFLVEVFDQILRREEAVLTAQYPRLSLREIHLIDGVCRAADRGEDNRATAIAASQGVTAGTLTTAVNLLERKGYVVRQRDEHDRRVVRILPTPLAREFHRAMVERVLSELTAAEADVLVETLGKLARFFAPEGGKTETEGNEV